MPELIAEEIEMALWLSTATEVTVVLSVVKEGESEVVEEAGVVAIEEDVPEEAAFSEGVGVAGAWAVSVCTVV